MLDEAICPHLSDAMDRWGQIWELIKNVGDRGFAGQKDQIITLKVFPEIRIR